MTSCLRHGDRIEKKEEEKKKNDPRLGGLVEADPLLATITLFVISVILMGLKFMNIIIDMF